MVVIKKLKQVELIKTFKKVLALLSKKEKKQGFWILLMITLVAILDVIGVASIMPFLAVAGNPSVIESNSALLIIYQAYSSFGSKDYGSFLIFLGISSFVFVGLASIFRIFTIYLANKFIELRRHSIAMRLLSIYLGHDYEYFIKHNASEISKNILLEVDQIVSNVLRPFFGIVSYSLVILVICFLLFFINFKIAILTTVSFGAIYLVIYMFFRKKLRLYGNILRDTNKDRFKTINEIFGGIKYLKIENKETKYLNSFSKPSEDFSYVQSSYQTISSTPNYVVEVILYGALIFLSLFFIISSGEGTSMENLSMALPIIGVYAFSAYRLKPAFHHIFQGLSGLRYGKEILDSLYSTIKKAPMNNFQELEHGEVNFLESLEIRNLGFSYPNSDKRILEGINFKVKKGASIGVVGVSGSGKTTLVDIILGLLKATEGEFLVDGQSINARKIRAWQKNVGYVPQDIFLLNASIAENIAFFSNENINYSKVTEVCKLAGIHDFICTLEDKYEHLIGEKGINISGGQRQRIGIARALYRNPMLLAFDEATSALDSETEAIVMNAVESLSKTITTIVIAHRISTVRNCDKIIFLENGKMLAYDKYAKLITNSKFKKIAGIK